MTGLSRNIPAAAALFLVGCVASDEAPVAVAPSPAPTPANAACDSAAADPVVGRLARAEVTEEARSLSGAEAVRVIGPGQPVTQEFRADRLNLETDGQNVIVALRCG